MAMEGRLQKAPQWTTLALCGALVAVGLVVRAVLLASPVGRLNADEAVVGLMADRILSVHHVPLFFWGQYYGGTIEPLMVAALFSVWRSVLGMRLIAIGLSLVAAGIVVVIGRRLFGDARAWVAGALVAAWPGTMYVSVREFGFYWTAFVLVALSLAFAMHLLSTAPAWPAVEVAAFGVVAGLAWWQSPQTAFVLLPLGVWLLVMARPPLRALPWVLGGAVVGAAPWLIALGKYGPGPLFAGPQHDVTYRGRLRLVFGYLLPRALGLRGSYNGPWLFSWIGHALFIAIVVGAVALFVVQLRAPRSPMAAIAWCVVAFPFVLAIPSATSRVTDPRYAILLVPLIALSLARFAVRPAATVLIVGAVVAFSFANMNSLLDTAAADTHGFELRPMTLAPAVHDLEALHIHYAYGDYWLALPLTFASHEHVILAPVDVVRSVEYQHAVDHSRSRVWIMYKAASRDRALPDEFRRRHIAFTRSTVGELAIYHLDRYLDPRTMIYFWRHHHAGAR